MGDTIDPNASHSEEVEDQLDNEDEQSVRDYYKAFGIDYSEDTDEDPDNDDLEETDEEVDPAIDQLPASGVKGVTVKHNGQDVTVDEEKVPEFLQMGLNYDKIKGRNQQYESALDRLAHQQGYKDHAELLANLDKIEQQQVQRQQDQFDQLKQRLRQEAEDAAIDPDALEQYLDNHPILKQARQVIEREQTAQQTRQLETVQQQAVQGWESLFAKYPDLADQVNADGTGATWLTADMQAKLQRGYDPIDAYELVHRDSLTAVTRKQAKQEVIKQTRLNKRGQSLGAAGAPLEAEVPQELQDAFKMFGLDPNEAAKYSKNFKR
ncbi:hypothetical protein [Paenibacillus sp. FSL L8-0333]|uniref:hypothetical protein n=1 Tax=Paenibacillus sp. FSL L8-0333 TaxID=2975331 RepID=UPI0030D5DB6C